MSRMRVVFCGFLFFPALARADAGSIRVNGLCQKDVEPDRAAIVMTAQAFAKEPAKATKAAQSAYENLRQAVKKLNLKDSKLETHQFSVNPEWDYSNNRQTLRGFTARVGLRVETSEVSRIGAVLEAASQNGIQDITSPSTFLSVALNRKEYEGCLSGALQNAKTKAEKLAKSVGKSVGEVLEIEEVVPGTSPGPIVPMHAKMEMASTGAPSFDVSTSSLSVSVNAKFKLQ